VQFAQVNVAQRVRVAHQVALPVVVEVVPGDSNPVAAADGVELAIVVVRADLWRELGFELVVVDPDAGAVLDGNAVVVDYEANGKVTYNDVSRIDDCDAALTDLSIFTNAKDGLVAADAEARR
jgi:putative intracellular protease/amidase